MFNKLIKNIFLIGIFFTIIIYNGKYILGSLGTSSLGEALSLKEKQIFNPEEKLEAEVEKLNAELDVPKLSPALKKLIKAYVKKAFNQIKNNQVPIEQLSIAFLPGAGYNMGTIEINKGGLQNILPTGISIELGNGLLNGTGLALNGLPSNNKPFSRLNSSSEPVLAGLSEENPKSVTYVESVATENAEINFVDPSLIEDAGQAAKVREINEEFIAAEDRVKFENKNKIHKLRRLAKRYKDAIDELLEVPSSKDVGPQAKKANQPEKPKSAKVKLMNDFKNMSTNVVTQIAEMEASFIQIDANGGMKYSINAPEIEKVVVKTFLTEAMEMEEDTQLYKDKPELKENLKGLAFLNRLKAQLGYTGTIEAEESENIMEKLMNEDYIKHKLVLDGNKIRVELKFDESRIKKAVQNSNALIYKLMNQPSSVNIFNDLVMRFYMKYNKEDKEFGYDYNYYFYMIHPVLEDIESAKREYIKSDENIKNNSENNAVIQATDFIDFIEKKIENENIKNYLLAFDSINTKEKLKNLYKYILSQPHEQNMGRNSVLKMLSQTLNRDFVWTILEKGNLNDRMEDILKNRGVLLDNALVLADLPRFITLANFMEHLDNKDHYNQIASFLYRYTPFYVRDCGPELEKVCREERRSDYYNNIYIQISNFDNSMYSKFQNIVRRMFNKYEYEYVLKLLIKNAKQYNGSFLTNYAMSLRGYYGGMSRDNRYYTPRAENSFIAYTDNYLRLEGRDGRRDMNRRIRNGMSGKRLKSLDNKVEDMKYYITAAPREYVSYYENLNPVSNPHFNFEYLNEQLSKHLLLMFRIENNNTDILFEIRQPRIRITNANYYGRNIIDINNDYYISNNRTRRDFISNTKIKTISDAISINNPDIDNRFFGYIY